MEEEQKQEKEQERDEFFEPVPEDRSTADYNNGGEWKPNKRANRIIAVVLAVVLLGIGFLIGWMVRYYTIDDELRAFLWALETTQKYYYLDIDTDKVYADAAGGDAAALMASLESQLDSYSCFYTRQEYAAVVAEGEGHNVGIGVSLGDIEVDGRTLPKVLLLVGNSPAERAGVRKGMYILGFGTEETLESGDCDAFISFLSRQSGSFLLSVGYEADGSDAQTVSLSREDYQASYCYYRDSETSYSFRAKSTYMELTETFEPIEGLDDSTAYIRIDEFSGYAAEEFAVCLTTMKERGRTDLILDLRTNGGGYLSILQSIASHLLRDATETYPAVATARYKNGTETVYKATERSDYWDYFTETSRVTLLADEYTASASECLIGALVDYGTLTYDDIYVRASKTESGELFGRSYGKGIMQTFFPGVPGVMKLTVATINWPLSGNCIHGVGVTSEDGAHAIEAEMFWGKEDVMLNAVIASVCNTAGSGSASDGMSL